MLKTNVKCRIQSKTNDTERALSVELNDEKIDDLYNWLEVIKLSRPKKNLARDFSDGLLMAELLKQFFPRQVDLNNYRPANSLSNKLKNWLWLNDKVLKPLGIGQEERALKDIASINLPRLENLLILVKEVIDEHEDMKIKKQNELLRSIYGEDELVEIDMKSMSQENNTLKIQLQERNEENSTLQAKVKHLEAMLELKDQRIEDLLAQLKVQTAESNIEMP